MIKEKNQTLTSLVANIVMNFSNSLQKFRNKILPPQAIMLDYAVGGFISNHSITIIAKLGISDILGDNVLSIQELAEKTDMHPDALYRIMRAVSSIGIFEELKGRKFRNNKLGKTLNSKSKNNILGLVKYVCSEWHHKQWASLEKCVENNSCIYRNLYNKRYYDWFQENPAASKAFNEGMINLSAISDKAIATSYNFSSAKSILDIAGGVGGQLATILRSAKNTKGAIFELEPVIDEISKYRLLEDVSDRIELISGDFFRSEIPKGYDIYFLKSIIHNWEDENAIKILTNIKKSMHKNSTLLIGGLLITKRNKPEFGKLLDVGMLAITGGVERTIEEYDTLFAKCGLTLNKVIKTPSPYCLLEVKRGDVT